MKNVIFIAPPAAGKGTQSMKLVEIGYTHITTGSMLREEINKNTSVGLKIKNTIDKGLLVNDEIVLNLITNKIKTINQPFVLDGFPRTYNQAVLLDKLFEDLKINNYEVIYLDIEFNEAVKRALGRLTCKCGATYNIYYDNLTPKLENICDKCGAKLKKRSDDNDSSIKIRFDTFIKNNEPIKKFYEQKNKLHIIDIKLDSNEITDRIKDILK